MSHSRIAIGTFDRLTTDKGHRSSAHGDYNAMEFLQVLKMN